MTGDGGEWDKACMRTTRSILALLCGMAGVLAAGCDVFYPPHLANGYPDPVVLRSRQAGETSEFLWHVPPGVSGVHRRPGTVYDRIEVQNAGGERLLVFEGEALEDGCRAAATNAAFWAILFEPAGARWLSKKEYLKWWEKSERMRKRSGESAE